MLVGPINILKHHYIIIALLVVLVNSNAEAGCSDVTFEEDLSSAIIGGEKSNEAMMYKLLQMESTVCEDYNRFILESFIIQLAIQLEEIEKAIFYAEQLQPRIEKYPDDWNAGNAIHYVNTVLGLEALNSGDIESAAKFLLKSIEINTTPQINSFGPSFRLASRLLALGEQNKVIEYLDKASLVWFHGKDKLKYWKHQIEEGKAPNFESL